jgi:hypothetical protein
MHEVKGGVDGSFGYSFEYPGWVEYVYFSLLNDKLSTSKASAQLLSDGNMVCPASGIVSAMARDSLKA